MDLSLLFFALSISAKRQRKKVLRLYFMARFLYPLSPPQRRLYLTWYKTDLASNRTAYEKKNLRLFFPIMHYSAFSGFLDTSPAERKRGYLDTMATPRRIGFAFRHCILMSILFVQAPRLDMMISCQRLQCVLGLCARLVFDFDFTRRISLGWHLVFDWVHVIWRFGWMAHRSKSSGIGMARCSFMPPDIFGLLG